MRSTNMCKADELKWLEDNCYDLRCIDEATGGGDYTVVWQVCGHYMNEPKLRILGTGNTPVKAIKNAQKKERE